jgi:hypothetical protein
MEMKLIAGSSKVKVRVEEGRRSLVLGLSVQQDVVG